jgi:hypothetical protein
METGIRIDPAIVFHTDMDISEMKSFKGHW